jgi:hypothetical protein
MSADERHQEIEGFDRLQILSSEAVHVAARSLLRFLLATGLVVSVTAATVGRVGAAIGSTSTSPHWTLQSTPAVSGDLTGVTCTSATACVAVGDQMNRTNSQVPLTEAWNGTSWRVKPSPSPSGALESYLSAVACTSATACVAVGTTEDSEGGYQGLAEAWNGKVWSIVPTPIVAGSFLNSVACVTATDCTAVGGHNSSLLAFGWNGKTWKIDPAVVPPGSITSHLDGLACTSATRCVAVGSYQNGSYTSLTLAEVWNGRSWQVQQTADEPGYGSLLVAVSCISATACSAVGYFGNMNASYALAESWNGKSWQAQPSPDPGGPGESNGPYNAPWAVACSSAASCNAVGSYVNSAGTLVTLAESWNGSNWATEATPNRPGATKSQLSAVWCTSSTACVAVGSSVGATTAPPLVERYGS